LAFLHLYLWLPQIPSSSIPGCRGQILNIIVTEGYFGTIILLNMHPMKLVSSYKTAGREISVSM
jgi:hypothetical protein